MQSIGQRLEEARNSKGISLREAAEATKIRSDFLGYFEQNKFEYDLPQIYRRGFLKNYARFLQLDPEKIITDYDAQALSQSRTEHKSGSELFGQVEIDTDNVSQTLEDDAGYGYIAPRNGRKTEAMPGDDEAHSNEKTFYLKIGLVFIGTLALVFIIFGLIKAILSSDNSEFESTANTAAAVSPAITTTANSLSSQAEKPAQGNLMTLIASGTVQVTVRQKNDNRVLLNAETMNDGQTLPLTKNGPVDVLFTSGKNIKILYMGEYWSPNGSGAGKFSIP